MRDSVGDLIAARRAKAMPCFCDRYDGDACTLQESTRRGADTFERLECRCGLIFQRVWVGRR